MTEPTPTAAVEVPPAAPDAPPTDAAVATPPTPAEAPPASVVPAREEEPREFGLAPDLPLRWPSLRACVTFLATLLLLGCVVYPLVVAGIGDVVPQPSSTTVSNEIGELVTNPALFWLRPSLLDWNLSNGSGETPYGPVDPSLRAAINQSIAEFGLYNTTVPLDLVTPSYSGFDADLYPDAVLVQVPRVAHYSGLPVTLLWHDVNATTVQPAAGIFGPTYVNVMALDRLLLLQLPEGTPVT